MTTWKPVPKVTAAALGGFTATLLVWLVNSIAGVEVPAEVGAAVGGLLAFAFGYVKAPADHTTDAGHADYALLLVALVCIVVILAVVGVL